MRNTAKKIYANLLVISFGIRQAQIVYAAPRLADARCVLLCVCFSSMFEVAYEMLPAFYCLKRYLLRYIYLVTNYFYLFITRNSD